MRKARPAPKARNRIQHRLAEPPGPENCRSSPPNIRIGISGWRYPGWRGKFYPEGLPHRRELEFASGAFNSIEINGSFYSLQPPANYRRWYAETPVDFLFAIKGGRFITHMKKLRDVKTALANFFASGILALREKLGPILWQLPPNLGFDPERLERFFALLPRSSRQAADLGAGHDHKLKARAFLQIDPATAGRPLRYAIEVRHSSFMIPDFFDILRRYNVAFVFADTAKRFPYSEDLTADFIYCRLHGDKELYASGYGERALDWWASRIKQWSVGRQPADARLVVPGKMDHQCRDVFVYFDNDAKVHAPFDAIGLAKRLRS